MVATPRKCPGREAPSSVSVIGQNRGVARQVARIFFEIVRLVKLRRVDEDRNDDDVGHLTGFADQRKMSFVQSAHRRNKADGFVLAPQFARQRCHSLSAVDNFHLLSNLFYIA
jgi:hypothetical protein